MVLSQSLSRLMSCFILFLFFSDLFGFSFWISGDAAVGAAHAALHGLTAEGRLRAEPNADAEAAIAGAVVLQPAAARLGDGWLG